MTVNFFILFLLWSIVGACIEGVIADIYNYWAIITPKDFYDNTQMNWFGSFVCYVLIRLISPAITIILLVLTIICGIWCFISWLFTVGRKKDE